MITGYNTDVRYGEIVLHVQTEDKGQGNPYIESLVYHRGQVVVAKRKNYAELLGEGKGDGEILSLMDHQHRAMIRAIQNGTFDEKIQPFLPTPEARTDQTTDEIELHDDGSRTLDQVILEYLTSEAEQEQLLLLMEDDTELRSGEHSILHLLTRSSKSGEPLAGVKINAKVISTSDGPKTLGAGETEVDGSLALGIDIPLVDRGTAALIVTAVSNLGQAELKHLL